MSSPNSFRSMAWLTALQALAMALPLLSMPILARALGVAAFGQVMWALGLSVLAVVWVDAGLNGESQRQVALGGSEETLANQHLDGAVLDEYFRERLHLGTVEVAMAERLLRGEVPRLDGVIVVQHEALEAHRDELERHVAADAAAPDDSDG